MAKAFATQGDLREKAICFNGFGTGLWAFTAEGDSSYSVMIGDECIVTVEAQSAASCPS